MLGPGLVEVLAADRAEPEALLRARDLRRQSERKRVAGPRTQVELLALDIGRRQVVAATRLIDLTGVDREGAVGALEAAHARAAQVRLITQPQRVARGHPR